MSISFEIRGMDCADEVGILKREVGPLVGGEENLSFDILGRKMTVLLAEDSVAEETIREAVARAGMEAVLWEQKDRGEDDSHRERRARLTLTGASGALIVAGFLVHWFLHGSFMEALFGGGEGDAHLYPLPSILIYLLAIVAGAWFVVPKAWSSAKRLRPDMNLLMTVAVLGAVGIQEWFEGATVAFLFAVSLALESWSVDRARRAVGALMDLAPPTARLLRKQGGQEEVAPEKVLVGSLFLVKPGERIPLDGHVIRGSSEVNQAPITGESVPIPKAAGDGVFAGTINGAGALDIECTKLARNTTLARIIHLVEEAQSRRAPSEQWVERFARIYTPVVMGLALAMLLIPPLISGGGWGEWFYRSLVLLVIACPCALVISTPVSIVAALAASARNGVLVKGGLYMEVPAHLRAIALDKTGTLTAGKPEVVEIVPLGEHDERQLLEVAAAMEARSEHPIAKAIVEYSRQHDVQILPAQEYQAIGGKGATARFEGNHYWLGSHRFLEESGQETDDVHQRLETMSNAGRTVVVVGCESHVCGLIAVADAVREEAKHAIQGMRESGVNHIVMLTGDNRGTALAVARETGVDDVRAELLPEDKLAAVEALVSEYGSVAMVGDGVNDAPAMGRATLGIAMGAAGSDAAIETADIALMSDDLSRLPWLIRHSRRTLAIIRQNIFFSLSVKALFVILAFLGYASLWAAIAADMGASLLVIFNGLRLLGSPPGKQGKDSREAGPGRQDRT